MSKAEVSVKGRRYIQGVGWVDTSPRHPKKKKRKTAKRRKAAPKKRAAKRKAPRRSGTMTIAQSNARLARILKTERKKVHTAERAAARAVKPKRKTARRKKTTTKRRTASRGALRACGHAKGKRPNDPCFPCKMKRARARAR